MFSPFKSGPMAQFQSPQPATIWINPSPTKKTSIFFKVFPGDSDRLGTNTPSFSQIDHCFGLNLIFCNISQILVNLLLYIYIFRCSRQQMWVKNNAINHPPKIKVFGKNWYSSHSQLSGLFMLYPHIYELYLWISMNL